MDVRRQSDGRILTLDPHQIVGSGGEAKVLAVPGDWRFVAKIFHRPSAARGQKVETMLATAPTVNLQAGHVSVAWPCDVLRDTGRERGVVGFLMPFADAAHPLAEMFNPLARRGISPLFTYQYIVRAARNFAATMAELHGHGIVVGDVNESNILVTDRALVTLVDTDSFQIRDAVRGHLFPCAVGKADYTPPELQRISLATVERTPTHDHFGLAVLIFQMLMEGTHPFAGVFTGTGDPPSIAARIAAGHFAYAGDATVPVRPMPAAPPFKLLAEPVRDLMRRAFVDGFANPEARPSAVEWRDALAVAEENLVACAENSQHRFGAHLDECPWCERRQLLRGRDPFPPREVVRMGAHQRMGSPTNAAALPPLDSPSAPAAAATPPVTPAPPSSPSPTPTASPPMITPRKATAWRAWLWLAVAALIAAFADANLPGVGMGSLILATIFGFIATVKAHPRRRSKRVCAVVFGVSFAVSVGQFAVMTFAPYWLYPAEEIFVADATISNHAGRIVSVDAAPNGKWLVSCDSAGHVRLWDLFDGSTALKAHPNANFYEVSRDLRFGKLAFWARVARFSPDGRWLFLGGNDGATKCFRETISPKRSANIFESVVEIAAENLARPVDAIAISPDGQWVAAVHDDGRVGVWATARLSDGSTPPLERLTIPAGIVERASAAQEFNMPVAVSFSPDSTRLAVAANGSLGIYDLRTLSPASTVVLERAMTAPLGGPYRRPTTVTFSADGRFLAVGIRDKPTLRNREAAERFFIETRQFLGTDYADLPRMISVVACERPLDAFAFSPTGGFALAASEGRLDLRHAGIRNDVAEPVGTHSAIVRAIAFTPDGRFAVTGGSDATLKVWRLGD